MTINNETFLTTLVEFTLNEEIPVDFWIHLPLKMAFVRKELSYNRRKMLIGKQYQTDKIKITFNIVF